MSDANAPLHAASSAQWPERQRILNAFETAWRGGGHPALADYLPAGPADLSLLLELARLDLEYRLRAGEAAGVESYLQRYPELAHDPGAVVSLVVAEYKFRGREAGRSPEEYLRRFPAYRSELASRLLLCDAPQQAPPQSLPGRPDPPISGAAKGQETVTESESHYETGPGQRARSAGCPSLPGYEVLEELGRGGMGVVYKARHLKLNRLVALKMIRAGIEADAAELSRFRRETEAVARLQHPNVVQIYEVGEHEGRPFFTMELVDGGNLGALLAGKPYPPPQAARLVEILARAVHHAHQHGIIHRDLKPANVLLAKPQAAELIPKITDFGLAKWLDLEASLLTQTGAIVGTPAYMAPEQATGQSGAIGPTADVYALGAILYEAITGQPPFRGATLLETLEQVRSHEPIPPRRLQPSVPRDLETICLKALAKEPAHRYPSALALAQDLELFAAGEPIRARPEGLAGRLWRKARRRPLAFASVLVLLVAGAVAGAIGLAASRDRHVAVLVNEIESGLQAPELTQAYLERMEARIAELHELLPEKAGPARQRLYQRFAGQIREKFGERLTAEQAAPLQTAIAWLNTRDADLAAALSKEYSRRLTSWEPVFQLRAPFANLPQVFLDAPNRVQQAAGSFLLRRPAGAAGAGADTYVFTEPTSPGNVRLTAVFEHSWAAAPQLGLVWLAGEEGYSFLLTVPESFAALGDPTPLQPVRATFADARKARTPVMLGLIRHHVGLLAVRQVPAAELFADCPPDGTLRLEVKREGGQLTFQVNQGHAVTFSELFPISLSEPLRFGVYWPEPVGLRSLQADRLLSPALPSPLENGDELYNRKDYAGARDEYQQAARRARADATRQEARYKDGLCLLALKRPEDAVPVFQALAMEPGPGAEARDRRDWPALADCQLLLAYHRQNTPDARAAADALLDKLIARRGHRPGEFASLIPVADRATLLNVRPFQAAEAMLRKPEDVVSECERNEKAAALFEPGEGVRLLLRVKLLTAYHLAGREAEALRLGYECQHQFQEFCQNHGLWGTWVLEQRCWLLRRRGADGARLAKKELDGWLFANPNGLRRDADGAVYFPLVERARIHAALGQWDRAEQDLDQFFQMQKQEQRRLYGFHAAACLLQGFLRERRGDAQGAQTAWRRGLVQSWAQEFPKEPAGLAAAADLAGGAGIALVQHIIMAALAGELSDREAEEVLNRLLSRTRVGLTPGEANAIGQFLSALKPPPGVLREAWRTPRGRAWARRIAYKDLSYAEYLRTPFLLVGAQALRQRALPGPATREQDDLLWKLCEDLNAAMLNGTLNDRHLLSLGAAWKGVKFPGLGWKEVDKAVLRGQPHLRGPLAYVLGYISLRRNQPGDAVTYFTIARDTRPENATLRRLAQAELDRLKAKQP